MSNNNSGFGDHPTQYARLNNDQLYAMFRESVTADWRNPKTGLLQETVNRDALEKAWLAHRRYSLQIFRQQKAATRQMAILR